MPQTEPLTDATENSKLQQAVLLHQKGQLSSAANIYESLIGAGSRNPKPYYLLGLIRHDLGDSKKGIELCTQALEFDANNPAALNNLGVIYAESGQTDAARAMYEKVISIQPLDEGALKNLLSILLEINDVDSAERLLLATIDRSPTQQWANLQWVTLLTISGRYQEAIAHLRALDRGTPDTEWVRSLLPAIQLEQQAANLASGSGSAHAQDAAVPEVAANIKKLFDAGQNELAIKTAAQFSSMFPQNTELMQLNSRGLQLAGRFQEAVDVAAKAVSLSPEVPELHFELASAYTLHGDFEKAQHALGQSLSIRPDKTIQAIADLNLPQIMGTSDEVQASRARYLEAITRLASDPPRLDLPQRGLGQSNFYLSFQGQNDKEPLAKFAQFCLGASPRLGYVAPHTQQSHTPGERIRIGFISDFIYNHSVAVCFARVVSWLSSNPQFELFLISSTPESAETKGMYSTYTGRFVHIQSNYEAARDRISELGLDVLFFMDLGMSIQNYYLALGRLARVQCALGGHPVTTGIPNIDHWLSCNLSESEDASSHYSENLVRFSSPPMYLERPHHLPKSKFGYPKRRADFGLPSSGRLYVCPVTLQKLHPDFDELLHQILDRDTTGYVVIVKSPVFDSWNQKILERHTRSLPKNISSRIVYIPWINSPTDFANFLLIADVVLDPLHFGIGSTAITLFAVGTPMVTLPSKFLRGRTGLFFSRALGIPEFVAGSPDDYVSKTVEIAANADLRQHIAKRIKENDSALYENTRPLNELAEFILQVASGGPPVTRRATSEAT